MKFAIIPIFFTIIFMSVLTTPVFSQVTDSETRLSVITTSDTPYVYTNDEGKTVVVGEIENRNALTAMSGVLICAVFYDASGEVIIETTCEQTILDIVPPQSVSPYVITSQSANSDIAQVSVKVEAFNSSPTKSLGLDIESVDILNTESLIFNGIIKIPKCPFL